MGRNECLFRTLGILEMDETHTAVFTRLLVSEYPYFVHETKRQEYPLKFFDLPVRRELRDVEICLAKSMVCSRGDGWSVPYVSRRLSRCWASVGTVSLSPERRPRGTLAYWSVGVCWLSGCCLFVRRDLFRHMEYRERSHFLFFGCRRYPVPVGIVEMVILAHPQCSILRVGVMKVAIRGFVLHCDTGWVNVGKVAFDPAFAATSLIELAKMHLLRNIPPPTSEASVCFPLSYHTRAVCSI